MLAGGFSRGFEPVSACRYYMGRGMADEDARQIKHWKAIRRHVRQLQLACEPGDLWCRRRQRQVLMHWAYDSRKL
jgi:hypothetical protein